MSRREGDTNANLRILAECSNHYSYQDQAFARESISVDMIWVTLYKKSPMQTSLTWFIKYRLLKEIPVVPCTCSQVDIYITLTSENHMPCNYISMPSLQLNHGRKSIRVQIQQHLLNATIGQF